VKWMVAVCCVSSDFLSKPAKFLSNPSSRKPTNWACGVVRAKNESEAYEVGLTAWEKGQLVGPQPGRKMWMMNWYVAPLTHASELANTKARRRLTGRAKSKSRGAKSSALSLSR
jgi:hypothetical protein